MPLGPGKYDELAMYCLTQAKASAAVVIIFEGNKGTGMSGKDTEFDLAAMNPAHVKKLPAVLRALAREIETALPGTYTAADS